MAVPSRAGSAKADKRCKDHQKEFRILLSIPLIYITDICAIQAQGASQICKAYKACCEAAWQMHGTMCTYLLSQSKRGGHLIAPPAAAAAARA